MEDTVVNNFDLVISQADSMRKLLDSDGWLIAQKLLDEKRAYFVERCLTQKNMDEIFYAQSAVNVIDSLLAELRAIVKQGDSAKKFKTATK